MKTFNDLIKEVQKPGLCHHCGGCVTFCTAINYGALELGPDGLPRYKDKDKCIECGLCYSICPVINELDEETKRLVGWSAPIGRVLKMTVARAANQEIRAKGTDGGVVTALLLHLLNKGRIDGAIVSKKVGPFKRQPWLATSPEDILEAAGFNFETSHGMELFSDEYSTYSPSILQLEQVAKKRLKRVAIVGTPCQINTLRRMEVLGIVPSDVIKYYLGLFCTGNFSFGEDERRRLEELGDFSWQDVRKINLKEELMVHLNNQEIRYIPLDKLDFMKRHACQYCDDYSAEYADLSFGGLGAEEGWTTVVIRTPIGRAIFADAKGVELEEYDFKDKPEYASQVMAKVLEWSQRKKQNAAEHDEALKQSLGGAGGLRVSGG
jgi:coenzyme F420 hydrogenase subunit beta